MEKPVKHDLVSLMAELSAEMDRFETRFPLESFRAGEYKQHPFATLLTCCDARVPPALFGDTFNRLFCVENIGNQVLNNLGSILYGVLHLHTPLLLIMGHTDCGAVKAASGDYSGEPVAIRQELNAVQSALQEAEQRGRAIVSDPSSLLRWGQLSEHNVDVQVERLLTVPEIRALVEQRELTIIGLHLDLHNVYDEGFGRVWVVNINGSAELQAMKAQATAVGFGSRLRRLL